MGLKAKKTINPSHLIFLLGGHDLEMVEIRNILEYKGVSFHDNNKSNNLKLNK